MTLVLHLPPETEARLRERASLEGRAEEEIALAAVEQLLGSADAPPRRKRNILEFEGVGKHNPVGMDAQEYVNQMRDEWDRPA
jgi:hypothetical protein